MFPLPSEHLYIPRAQVHYILQSTFPDYGREWVEVKVVPEVRLGNLNWANGARSVWGVYALQSGVSAVAHVANRPLYQRNPYEGRIVRSRPGYVILEDRHLHNEPAIMRLYLHPTDAAKFLNGQPKPAQAAHRAAKSISLW